MLLNALSTNPISLLLAYTPDVSFGLANRNAISSTSYYWTYHQNQKIMLFYS